MSVISISSQQRIVILSARYDVHSALTITGLGQAAQQLSSRWTDSVIGVAFYAIHKARDGSLVMKNRSKRT